MDDFTQNLLERARQRREELSKKLADAQTVRKRSVEDQVTPADHIITSLNKNNESDGDICTARVVHSLLIEDSPNKRKCLQDSNRDMSTTSSTRTASAHVDPDDTENRCDSGDKTSGGGVAGYRQRMAALANKFSSFEDDLSHPTATPRMQDNDVKASSRATVKTNSVPQAPPTPPVYTPGPPKPPRGADPTPDPVSVIFDKMSDSSASRVEPVTHVSSITVMVGNKSGALNKPADQRVVEPSSAKSVDTRGRTAYGRAAVLGQSSANAASKSGGNVQIKQTTVKTGGFDPNDSIMEPTKQPVSARLAAWQQKTAADETPVQSRVREIERRAASANALRVRAMTGATKATIAQTSPTMSRTPASGMPKTPSSGTLVKKPSPSKSAQPGTQSLQQRLIEQFGRGVTDVGEMERRKRAEELERLERRWREEGGGLEAAEDSADERSERFRVRDVSNKTRRRSSSVPPRPPPLPSVLPSSQTPARGARDDIHVTQGSSGKKEQAREKARADFEDKLRQMGFDVNSRSDTAAVALSHTPGSAARPPSGNRVTSLTKQPINKAISQPIIEETRVTTTTFSDQENVTVNKKKLVGLSSLDPGTPGASRVAGGTPGAARVPSGRGAGGTPGSNSIYNLIRKQMGSAVSVAVIAGDSPVEQQSQGSRRKQPMEDSFDDTLYDNDDDDVDDDDRVGRPTVTFNHEVDQRFISDVGESTIDESNAAIDSDDDDDGDMEEEEFEDSEDDTDDSGENVDGVLDEALLDETMTEEQEQPSLDSHVKITEEPTFTPSVAEPQAAEIKPAHKVVMRKKSSKKFDGYISIQEYRLSQQKQKLPSSNYISRPARREVVSAAPVLSSTHSAHHENSSSAPAHSRSRPVTSITPYVTEQSVKQRMKELQEQISIELSVIQQTSNALNQCCHDQSSFAGSAEAVECHRLLLIACKKREACCMELQRLREQGTAALLGPAGPRGRITITDIRLPLKSEFVNKIATIHDNAVHYFIAMIRHGSHIVFTQMVSTHDAATVRAGGRLDFPNLINIDNVSGDSFIIDVEIYSMSVTKPDDLSTPKKKKTGVTPKKLMTPKTLRRFESPGGPAAVRTTNFVFVSSLQLNKSHLLKTHFSLDRVPFTCPLQSSIHLRLKCLMETCIEERGFLTMFEDVSGFGAWHRRWCVLKNNSMSYWKYPDDERDKEPMGTIDLKMCITDSVGLISRDVCARPNSFELCTIRKQSRGDRDTLVTKLADTVTTTKHWFSADTKDERMMWCGRLNEVLNSLRAWHPDAVRPPHRVVTNSPAKPPVKPPHTSHTPHKLYPSLDA